MADKIMLYYQDKDGSIKTSAASVPSVEDKTLAEVVSDEQAEKQLLKIKTVNGESLIGEGNIEIQGGSSVVANPTLSGDEAVLEGLTVGDETFKIEAGSADIDIPTVEATATLSEEASTSMYTVYTLEFATEEDISDLKFFDLVVSGDDLDTVTIAFRPVNLQGDPLHSWFGFGVSNSAKWETYVIDPGATPNTFELLKFRSQVDIPTLETTATLSEETSTYNVYSLELSPAEAISIIDLNFFDLSVTSDDLGTVSIAFRYVASVNSWIGQGISDTGVVATYYLPHSGEQPTLIKFISQGGVNIPTIEAEATLSDETSTYNVYELELATEEDISDLKFFNLAVSGDDLETTTIAFRLVSSDASYYWLGSSASSASGWDNYVVIPGAPGETLDLTFNLIKFISNNTSNEPKTVNIAWSGKGSVTDGALADGSAWSTVAEWQAARPSTVMAKLFYPTEADDEVFYSGVLTLATSVEDVDYYVSPFTELDYNYVSGGDADHLYFGYIRVYFNNSSISMKVYSLYSEVPQEADK